MRKSMSIFMRIAATAAAAVAVVASVVVSRGRPRFHEHGVGRHCDSRRDLTVFRLVGDVAEPPTLGHFGSVAALWLFHLTTVRLSSARQLSTSRGSHPSFADDIHPARSPRGMTNFT